MAARGFYTGMGAEEGESDLEMEDWEGRRKRGMEGQRLDNFS